MKQNRLFGLAAALLVGTALTTPAKADFDVLAVIAKDKSVVVNEEINITKMFDISATVFPVLNAAAESLTVANQRVQGNTIDAIRNVGNISEIGGSINYNEGITAQNQDSGNASNQGNVGSFALVNDADAFTNAEVSAEQINGDEVVPILGDIGEVIDWEVTSGNHNLIFSALVVKDASIHDSVSNNTGIVHVNQNAGDLNNQLNALAVAVGVEGTAAGAAGNFALAEADLGQETANAQIFDFNVQRQARIANSGYGNRGIIGVNQAAGVMGNQANLAAVAAVKSVQ